MNTPYHQKNSVKTHKIHLPDCGILAQSWQKRPGFAEISHLHQYSSILYVVSGSGKIEYDHKQYDLTTDTIATLAMNQKHRLIDKPRNAMTVFSLYFKASLSGMNQEIVENLFSYQVPFVLPTYHAEQVRRNLRQILHEQNLRPPNWDSAIQQHFNLIILQIHRANLQQIQSVTPLTKESSTQRVQAALDFIATNHHEQYSLSDAAKIAKVSQRQFTNLCRKITAKSFIQFLNELRCQRAKNLLEGTTMPVSAIAFEVGYEELSTFYRAFKKYSKINPLAFRSSI